MEKCANCQAPLDPAWKFCVKCGTPTPAAAPPATQSRQTPSESRDELPQNEQPPREPPEEKSLTRAALKAAAAPSTVASKPKRTKDRPANAPGAETRPWAGNVLVEEIPAAIRNSQDGPPARATGRRKLDVPLIVSISLGAAGTILIVYLVILVFGTRG
jgi:hypothetical protein